MRDTDVEGRYQPARPWRCMHREVGVRSDVPNGDVIERHIPRLAGGAEDTSLTVNVTGSLGLLGRAKRLGLISAVGPWLDRLGAAGIYFHPDLLKSFLSAMGE
jgi:hypothetical protein